MHFFKILFLFSIPAISITVNAQTDTTELEKNTLSVNQKFGSIKFTGYIQPQYQWAEEKGTKSFAGGDFAPHSNNRFMLRRSRIRADYSYHNKKDQLATYFVFQIDATERGVFARDIWGRFFENKWELFHVTTGLFARPFGFEVNLSSSDRESPERGRMSQTLMKTERDIGAMLTLEPRKKSAALKLLKIDVGLFNGQGLTTTTDYDSYKDLIGRISIKPFKIKPLGLIISGGGSVLYGAVGNQSPWLYQVRKINGVQQFVGDSATSNVDYKSPRHYYGADIQIKLPNKKGFTELRVEYIRGKQSATANSSETPGAYPVSSNGVAQPLYVRSFDGAYFYFLQHLFSEQHQLVVKYDWYDPNTKINGGEISTSNGMSAADIKFNTLGIGYVYYVNEHLKATFYYDMITNENTNIAGYTTDAKDNILTCRLQYRF